MKVIIQTICPHAAIIDISHGIAPQRIAGDGSFYGRHIATSLQKPFSLCKLYDKPSLVVDLSKENQESDVFQWIKENR